jgi:hypothetical protein
VCGPRLPVHAFVIALVGSDESWSLVTSALDLTAAQVVEAWAARFRRADSFRDHKQRLGMKACRAWTQEPILRTCQVQLVALSLRRLLHARLDQTWGAGPRWHKPAWKQHKRHASILDLRRLCWRYRTECSHCLLGLEKMEKSPHSPALRSDLPGRAA